MVSNSFAPILTPHGRLTLGSVAEGPGLDPSLARRLEDAFARGSGHGLLQLGAGEVGTALPPVFSYWRELATRYVTAVCTLWKWLKPRMPRPRCQLRRRSQSAQNGGSTRKPKQGRAPVKEGPSGASPQNPHPQQYQQNQGMIKSLARKMKAKLRMGFAQPSLNRS